MTRARAPEPKAAKGRPRKSQSRMPVAEIEHLLVHGEVVTHPQTGVVTVHYPSYREIAERFSVANSSVAQFAAKHNCLARRADVERKTRDATEKKLIARRADALALSNEDTVRIIDGYIVGFYDALEGGRVRCDNPSDLATLVRLKQLLIGGADSRQEVSQSITLEALQARHRESKRAALNASPAECGLAEGTRERAESTRAADDSDDGPPSDPPAEAL